MPRAVIEEGLADLALPLGELAEAIVAEAGA
jgi:chemotaxis response regulator CheB